MPFTGSNGTEEELERFRQTFHFMKEDEEETNKDHDEDDRKDVIGETLFKINQARGLYKLKNVEQRDPADELNLFNNINFKQLQTKQLIQHSENEADFSFRPRNVQSVEELERGYFKAREDGERFLTWFNC